MLWDGALRVLFGQQVETIKGPVTITSNSAEADQLGLRYLILMLLMVTPLCLLPLPPLPGGRLLLLGIEAARERPLSSRARWTAMFIGLGVLALALLFALSKDLLRFMTV